MPRSPALALTAFGFMLIASLTSSDVTSQEPRRAPVSVVTATSAPIKRIVEVSGSVVAARAASLSAATSGLVENLEVDVGDRVDVGDVLLTLDDELARFQLASDTAARKRAEQALRDAQRRLSEAQELIEKQTIAQTAVLDLQSEVVEDEAELARLSAIAGLSKTTLERHSLKAPFTGVVSARNTDLGEWITPGQAILELVSLAEIFVDLQVAESYLDAIEPGMPLIVTIGADDTELAATVASVVPVTDPTARTFLVRARANEPAAKLRPGVSASAVFSLETGRSRVTVPRDAVLRFADGRSVAWVILSEDGSDRADERIVRTGLSFDGQLEIIEGINPGEQVVVIGNESLRSNQQVRIVSGAR